jgi:hypothetical protein
VRDRCRVMSSGLRHECPCDSAAAPVRHLLDLPCYCPDFPCHSGIPGHLAAWREGSYRLMRHSYLD